MSTDEEFSTRAFIQAYEEMPVLWDCSHNYYYHKLRRQNCVQELAKAFSLTSKCMLLYDIVT